MDAGKRNDLIQNLTLLKHSMRKITKMWDEDPDECNKALNTMYPFATSFDDLSKEVENWVEDAQSKLSIYDKEVLSIAYEKMDKYLPEDSNTQGEYYDIMDDETISYPEKTEQIVEFLQCNVCDEERLEAYLDGHTYHQFAEYLIDTYA